MTAPNRKDEILTRIIELQRDNEQRELEKINLTESLKTYSKQKEVITTAYREVTKQLDKITELHNMTSSDLTSVGRVLQANSQDIDRLKRELARLQDAEKINAEYLAQLEAFKQSCLTAPWRAENRGDGLGAKSYQIDGAIHMAVAQQGILGDKRGLGKTLTSLIWADLVEAHKIIAIVPADIMMNFAREVQLWAPHRKAIVIGRQERMVRDILLDALKNEPEFIVILNYEAWRKDSSLIESLQKLKADTLICDEAHRSKEQGTVTCDGVYALRFGVNGDCPECIVGNQFVPTTKRDIWRCSTCDYEAFVTEFCSVVNVLPMTGTPILNSPQEIFPLLRMVDPENFYDINVFLRDFCVKMSNQRWRWMWGAEKKLMDIIGPRFLGRDRNSVGVEMPDPIPVRHTITMAEMKESYPKQHKAYIQTRDYAQLVLDPDNEVTMSMAYKIVVLMRLRQVLTWPAQIELKVQEKIGEDLQGNPVLEEKVLATLDVKESIKLDRAEELIRDLIKEKERFVLFSQFKQPLRELQRRLGSSVAVYDGDTPPNERNEIQLDFDAKTAPKEPKYAGVLCNYKAAGEGLNFQTASHVILLDREWNPGRESQAIGRADRIGQTKAVQVHIFEVENSVDTWMEGIIDEKADMVGGFEHTADDYRKVFDALKNGEM